MGIKKKEGSKGMKKKEGSKAIGQIRLLVSTGCKLCPKRGLSRDNGSINSGSGLEKQLMI